MKTPNTSRPDRRLWTLPLTTTRPALLSGKSDHAFRKLLYDFFTVSNRIEEIRRRLAARIGLSGPQYSIMMAIAQLQGSIGVSVGEVAEYLHVAGTFIATETGKLARMGYVDKNHDARDRRVSLLRISREGGSLLESLLDEIRLANDTTFDFVSTGQFETMCGTLARMVESSGRALVYYKAEDMAG